MKEHNAPPGLTLSDRDRAMLSGELGGGAALAMRVVSRTAHVMGAQHLIDIQSAHIDGCLYHGQTSLDFVERFVADGARVAVPTTLNVGSMDLIHPERFRGDDALAQAGTRLMHAHQELGCEPTFTCAPYQRAHRPGLGDQIAWAESNAIIFANSVLGARTNRYGDFLDLAAAITGRAPGAGLHLREHRAARVVIEAPDFDHRGDGARDVHFASLGLLLGKKAGARVAAITGLPLDTTEDELKALGAAAASSGAVALFHAVGITPEAPTLSAALQDRAPEAVITVSMAELLAVRQSLNTGRPGDPLTAIALGTPHFSMAEFAHLFTLLNADTRALQCDFYINTSRFILWQLEESGADRLLAERGIDIVVDTCTYLTPVMRDMSGLIMTNSGKWAHYAPANIGVRVAFGSLGECVRSAIEGRVCFDA